MKKLMFVLCFMTIYLGVIENGGATNLILTTESEATIGGLTFKDGDLINYDTITDSAWLIFDENLFTGNEEIDAVAMQSNGNILLSTAGDATLGGLSFSGGDLIEYDPISDTSSLFFANTNFTDPENINALTVFNNGNIALSVRGNNGATLAGVTFRDGDLVEYNPSTGSATLLFSEDWFTGDADIDAVTMLNNNLLISTLDFATLAGLSFSDGDLVEYNTSTGTASLFLAESMFAGNTDINGVSIAQFSPTPEPSTILLFSLGLGVFGIFRVKKIDLN